jgi:hypothetical protein
LLLIGASDQLIMQQALNDSGDRFHVSTKFFFVLCSSRHDRRPQDRLAIVGRNIHHVIFYRKWNSNGQNAAIGSGNPF